MASLEQQYVNHLRKSARSNESYVCILCNHRITNAGKQGFEKHLDSVHSNEVEHSSSKDPNFDLASWKDDIESQSKAAATSGGVELEEASPSHGQTTTQAMKNLALDSRKKSSPRRLVPKTDSRPPAEPGGHKRSRSTDEHNQRGASRQSKSNNPRRAVPKDEHDDQPNQFSRTGTFQSNWGTDGQPTRQLFNPADGPPPPSAGPTPAPAAGVTSTSRAAQSSDVRHQTPSLSTTTSTQPTQTKQERGVLPMPAVASQARAIAMPVDPRWPDMLLQPDSRPISQEQLAAEVKSIYAGLTMVESKCIHVDKAQALAMREGETKILNDHWQALIALHKTLLHEHHDFFLASQHPSASPALRRLAAKYSMPARMWKHGIHSFLELLRYRLPESLEFMISFIYTAYQMMSLLYETVPAFKNTWIECLGDLGRYRMAIEDEDVRDRENWANVSRFWYTKAADNTPEVGRLYHHLAILARPNALQQLSLYARSLISVSIFASARESILTLFNPFLGRTDSGSHVPQLDSFFIKAHALIFSKEEQDLQQCQASFLELLDPHIGRVTAKWREQGAWIMIAQLGALFDYGTDSPLRRAFELGYHRLEQQVRSSSQASRSPVFDPQKSVTSDGDSTMEDVKSIGTVDEKTQRAWDSALTFTVAIVTLVLQRKGDKNVLPFIHIWLAFLLSLTKVCEADAQVKSSYVATAIFAAVPLKQLAAFLNTLSKSDAADPSYESNTFIRPEKGDSIPLPEDHLIRGQVWSQDYFPADLFRSVGSDDEEKNIEHASTVRMRSDRVLNIGYQISQRHVGLRYDTISKMFSYDQINSASKHAPTLRTPLLDAEILTGMEPAGRLPDLDSTYESDEDAPENKTMSRAVREPPNRPLDASRLGPPSGSPTEADDIMKSGDTYVVCDRKVIMYDQKMVRLLVKEHYTIVIPKRVLSDLMMKSKEKQAQPDTNDAQQTLELIKDAHHTNDQIKVLDTAGNDVTERQLDSSLSSEDPRSSRDVSPEDDPETELIGVTRRATDMSLRSRHEFGTATGAHASKAKPAILLTEDKSTRATAAKGGVPALSPGILKQYFEKGVKRIRSRAPSRSSGSSPVTTPPMSASKDLSSSGPDQIMGNAP